MAESFTSSVRSGAETLGGGIGGGLAALTRGTIKVVSTPFRLVGKLFGFAGNTAGAAIGGLQDGLSGRTARIANSGAAASGLAADAQWAAETLKRSDLSKEAKEAARGQIREFNRAAQEAGVARGNLSESVGNFFRKMFGVFSKETPASAHLPDGNAFKRLNAATREAAWFERVLSKPLRVAANHPRIAWVGAGLAAIAGGAAFMQHRNAQATQDEALATVTAMPLPRTNSPYQISPEDSALLASRMRGGDGPTGGHADAVLAAREAAAAAAERPPVN